MSSRILKTERKRKSNCHLYTEFTPKAPLSERRKNTLTIKLSFAAAMILLLSHPMWAGGLHKRHSNAPTQATPDYVFALATADLHACLADG